MASGVLQIKQFWDNLGPNKAKALPALHAISGADNTGRCARVVKATWFKIFPEAQDENIEALQMLSDDSKVTEEQQKHLATFV